MDALKIRAQGRDNFQSINIQKSDQILTLQGLITQKKWEEAALLARQLSDVESNNPKYHYCCAEIKTHESDYPAALNIYHELLDRMADQDPMYFDVYKNMGNIYLKCGDIEAAEEKYNQAYAINSMDESLAINYGVLYIQKGEYSAAKNRFSEVLERNLSSDLAWVGVGLVHRAHSDHELARACLLRGLDENPYNKLAISNYYNWCEEDGVEASINHINSFLNEFPNDDEMKRLQKGLNQ